LGEVLRRQFTRVNGKLVISAQIVLRGRRLYNAQRFKNSTSQSRARR